MSAEINPSVEPTLPKNSLKDASLHKPIISADYLFAQISQRHGNEVRIPSLGIIIVEEDLNNEEDIT